MADLKELDALREAAVSAALEAGKLTLRYFQTSSLAVEIKADQSPVTIADKGAEELIVRFIQKHFPDHSILGEEFGEIKGNGHYRWIIDPIDGTKSFVHGVPFYGTMVGIEDVRIQDTVVGVVHFPALGEMHWAARGLGAYWNGRRSRVSEINRISDAVLLLTDIRHAQSHAKVAAYQKLLNECQFTRTWGDCYGHMMVATGRAEIMLDPKMNLWDVAALKPIIEEAGGKFFDWNGRNELRIDDAIACNATLENEVIRLLMQ